MNPEKVLDWREALIRLSDQYFFDLVRLYLGAIKTPFNKQKLIAELSAFLRKKENRERIFLALDDVDKLVLSAVSEMPSPTQQKIVALFSGFLSFPEIYERILNLEERLLMYRKGDSGNREYALNPLLEDDLAPLLGVAILAKPETSGDPVSAPVRVDDLTLAALYGFFIQNEEAVKNDGTLRKKTLSDLEAAFPQFGGSSGAIPLLISAFMNLGLLVRENGLLKPERGRWEAFARQENAARLAWLVAAAGGHAIREILLARAQTFTDFFFALDPRARYSRHSVHRMSVLFSEKSGKSRTTRSHGRFAAMLLEQSEEIAQQTHGAHPVEAALCFGALVETEGFLCRNSSLSERPQGSAAQPFLVVSPSLSVTLMPGFTLASLLPLVSFMEVRDVQIAGQFEITRKSCMAAFSRGQSAQEMIALLEAHSSRPIPQNVVFSINDWFRSYSAFSLYRGFVMYVEKSRRVAFEKNSSFSSLIRKELAPGVYLLDAEEYEDIAAAFSDAGYEAAPAVSAVPVVRDSIPLPTLRLPPALAGAGGSGAGDAGAGDVAQASNENALTGAGWQELRAALFASLDALALPHDIHEVLASRIDRKIIITESQLVAESIRIEKVEARGMDFLGKVRIAEYAISAGSLLEIELEEGEGSRYVLGKPLSTEKKTGDVLLRLITEPDGLSLQISLGKALLVRRIRGSIFSELPAGRI